jgi:hypothetical protein
MSIFILLSGFGEISHTSELHKTASCARSPRSGKHNGGDMHAQRRDAKSEAHCTTTRELTHTSACWRR